MNDPGYIVVFNILDSGYRQWWFPAFGLLLGVAFVLVFHYVFEEEKS